jgi:hypothetical protein
MTRLQYRQLLRGAPPPVAKWLKVACKLNGLQGLSGLDNCANCRQPSNYLKPIHLGFFTPTSQLAVRKVRWLMPPGTKKPMLVYSLCSRCSHIYPNNIERIERALYADADARMRAAGIEPPIDVFTYVKTIELADYMNGEAYPQDLEDLTARLHGTNVPQ